MERTTKPLGITWDQIKELIEKDWTVRDIALRLGCSSQNIHVRIKKQREKAASK